MVALVARVAAIVDVDRTKFIDWRASVLFSTLNRRLRCV